VPCDREHDGRRQRQVRGECGEQPGGGLQLCVGGCGRYVSVSPGSGLQGLGNIGDWGAQGRGTLKKHINICYPKHIDE